LTALLSVTGLARSVRHRSHEARADLFLELLAPPPRARLLDLGGSDGSLAARIVARRPDLDVTVADVSASRFLAQERYGFNVATLDPEGPLPFADAEFDVVLCNSVIEHVTLPRDRCLNDRLAEPVWRAAALARQRQFAEGGPPRRPPLPRPDATPGFPGRRPPLAAVHEPAEP
jgi:SAM-dependent methyltransferase